MTGIIPIIAGVFILYLVVTGNVDCYIAAFRACRQKQSGGDTGAIKTGGSTTDANPSKAKNPKEILDSVFRS